MKRLILLGGTVAAAVLSTQGGRRRLEAAARDARRLVDRPEIQSAAGTVAGQAMAAVKAARAKVR